jgi:hypothetical protein
VKIDKFLVAVTISIFLLAGLFNFFYEIYARNVSANLTGLVVAGFLGWATFYAAGAGKGGLIKGIPANLTGIFWGVVIVWIWGLLNFNLFGAFLAVAIGAGMMCFQAHVKALGFIPGAFIGCSTFFAVGAAINGTVLIPAVLGLLIGLILGYVSEQFAIYLNKNLLKAE